MRRLLLVAALFFFLQSGDGGRNTAVAGKPAPDASLSKGTAVFNARNCASCHQTMGKGGCLGPPLDGVSTRRTKEFMLSRITDSESDRKRFGQLYGSPELMPHPRIPAGDAREVVSYLATLKAPRPGYYVVGSHKPKAAPGKSRKPAAPAGKAPTDIQEGQRLFSALGCAACHSVGQVGGQFAPRLDGIGARMSVDSIESHILSGELQVVGSPGDKRDPRFMMPPANISAREAGQIARFLHSLPRKS